MIARFALLALPMLLVGCGDDPAPVTDDEGREATGEVLEGSISDAMIPLGEVRSQPPLEEVPEESGESAGATADAADPAPTEEPGVEPAPEADDATPEEGEE